ncbi:protein of unknown function [Lactiplantibacillus plantarum]
MGNGLIQAIPKTVILSLQLGNLTVLFLIGQSLMNEALPN